MEDYEESPTAKFMRKTRQNPSFPIGIAGLIGVLCYGALKYKNKGDMKTSLYLIHLRMAAQGTVVGCISISMLYTLGFLRERDPQISKLFFESSPYLYDIREEGIALDDLVLKYEELSLKEIVREYAITLQSVESMLRDVSPLEKLLRVKGRLPDKVNAVVKVSAKCGCHKSKGCEKSVMTCHQTLRESYTQTKLEMVTRSTQTTAEEPTVSRSAESCGVQESQNFVTRPETPVSPEPNETECDHMDVKSEQESKVNWEIPLRSLTRSRSCSDLCNTSPSEDIKKARRRFFTPNKLRDIEPSAEVIKSTYQELLENHKIHEKLAQSINNAMAEVAVDVPDDELDNALQSIIEKATSNPAFDEIMNETLGSFDMAQFLKPKVNSSLSDETASVDENSSKTKSHRPRRRHKPPEPPSFPTAEMVPYPNIWDTAVDNSIYVAGLNEQGDVVFYANPQNPNSQVFLPPPPSQLSDKRYRRIQPKPIAPRDPSAYNVVVVTPMMPAPKALEPPPPPPPRRQKKITTGNDNLTRGTSSKEPVFIPPTPGRVYTDDMPVLSTPNTPRDPPETKLPTPPSQQEEPAKPEVPPEVTPSQAPVRRRKTQSTPRRKSYIRALEFETPQKDFDVKKSATSPKKIAEERNNRTPQDERASEENAESKPQAKRKALTNINTPLKGKLDLIPKGPIATKTPNETSLSRFWDPMEIVMPQKENEVSPNQPEVPPNQQLWDSGLRQNIVEGSDMADCGRRRRRRKIRPKNSPKVAKNGPPRRMTRSSVVIMSPSKKHAKSTTKRSTFTISHGSSSAFETSSSDEELIKVVEPKKTEFEITPAKIDLPVVVAACEDTPFTKLLKENVVSMDIDLSMLTTPVFPPTPSILNFANDPVTPIHETRNTDYSSGSSYYKPDLTSPSSCLKDIAVEVLEKSEEHLQDVSTVSGRNLVLTPEEKDHTVTENRENSIEESHIEIETTVIELPAKDNSSEDVLKGEACNLRKPELKSARKNLRIVKSKKSPTLDKRINTILSEGKKISCLRKCPGKNMSLLKLQTIAKCETKISRNIPITEKNCLETSKVEESAPGNPQEAIPEVPETLSQTTNILEAVELKRQEVIRKLKTTGACKRSRKPLDRPSKKFRTSLKKTVMPSPPKEKPDVVITSTPNKVDLQRTSLPESPIQAKPLTPGKNSPKDPLPQFVDDGRFPELPINTKKKFFAADFLLKQPEVRECLQGSSQIKIRAFYRGMIKALYKWLNCPHDNEVNSSERAREQIQIYLTQFRKIHEVLSSIKSRESSDESPLERRRGKSPGRSRSKQSLLPLKKRKNPQQVNEKPGEKDTPIDKMTGKENRTNVKRDCKVEVPIKVLEGSASSIPGNVNAQIILQDVDVDRFLSRVHGRELNSKQLERSTSPGKDVTES